jgi:hypothetical protein
MLSPALARILAAARPWFNERAAEARHRQPGFDVDALRDFIAVELDALAAAVARVEPDRAGEAVQVAYGIGIELVGQRLIGPQARSPWVRRTWEAIVPAAAPLVARDPFDVLGALSNAALQLGTTPGARAAQWIEFLARAAPQCTDVEMLRSAGAVCAWRAGMVSLRGAALAAGERLPARLAMTCLGLDPGTDREAMWSQLRAGRWSVPGDAKAPGHVLGGFTGFGGLFAEPPAIRVDATGFVARAGGRAYSLDADAFGAAAMSAGLERFDAARGAPFALDREARESLAARLQVPKDDLVAVAHEHSLVASSPWSHRVFVGPQPS